MCVCVCVCIRYLEDCKLYPDCFIPATRQHFSRVWALRCPEMKLRKWLRFSKCSTCEKHRAIRFSRESSREAKEDSTRILIAHYKWVKAERAYAHSKKVQAKQQPHQLLSIAVDGTDQLPNGLPQFHQATSNGVFCSLSLSLAIDGTDQLPKGLPQFHQATSNGLF